MKRIFVTLILSIISEICMAQSVDELYNKTLKNWKSIDIKTATIDDIYGYNKQTKTIIKKEYKGDKSMLDRALMYNDYQLITVLAGRAKTITKKELSGLVTLDLNSQWLVGYMEKRLSLLNDYYMLLSIKEGNSYEDSKSGMLFNTSYGGALKEVDYRNMREVLSSENNRLKDSYLGTITMAIRFNGLTCKLLELLPLIEKNTKDGELKRNVLTTYKNYEHLLPGKVAPNFTLRDYKGNDYSLSDYKGKVVVIDVWATWCGGCIDKLPYFLKLRDKYKGREEIVFLVISTDNKAAYNKWKFAHPKYNLMDITSLVVCENNNTFVKDYNVTGIPRYMVIDKQGKIVTVYGPSPYPADDLIKIIEYSLK